MFLGKHEVGIAAVSALHWLDAGRDAGEIRQSVVLRRAVSTDRTLYEWRARVEKGRSQSREVTIAQLGEPDGSPINIWVLREAVPIRWTGPSFDALSGAIAYEELEIRYQSVDWRTRV